MKQLCLKRFYLRYHLRELYEIITSPVEQKWIYPQIAINSDVDFEGWLMNQLKYAWHDFFIVEEGQTGAFMGFVYSYEFLPNDGHSKICVYLTPEYRNSGLGALAAIQFMKLLFTQYSLRKLFITIYDYNQESLASNLQAGFVKEGCLKEYRYLDQKYYDLHILAIERAVFEQRLAGLVEEA